MSIWANSKELIVVERTQTIREDFFASGSVIEISGICEKDVYVSATQLVIDGVIEGDLICFSGSLQITGTVKGAVRGVVGQAFIAGTIEKNVTLLSAAITTTPSARFLGNFFVATANADCAGYFAQNGYLGASHIRYSGILENDAYFYAGTIRLGAKSFIGGALHYSSPEPVAFQAGAIVQKGLVSRDLGTHFFVRSEWLDKLFLGSKIAGWLMNLAFTILVGIFLIKIWPASFQKSFYYLKNHFARSVLQGMMFVIVVPIVGTVLLMTVLGIPIALTVIAFSILGLYTAKIHTLYYCSELVKRQFFKHGRLMPIFIGLSFVYFLIQPVPLIGTGVAAFFTLSGLGALLHIPRIGKKT